VNSTPDHFDYLRKYEEIVERLQSYQA
jgi:hypothetical protein